MAYGISAASAISKAIIIVIHVLNNDVLPVFEKYGAGITTIL